MRTNTFLAPSTQMENIMQKPLQKLKLPEERQARKAQAIRLKQKLQKR